jgi:hypothetical protein
MDVVTFFNRNERTEDHGIKRSERQSKSRLYIADKTREHIEQGWLADHLAEEAGKSRAYWLRRLMEA